MSFAIDEALEQLLQSRDLTREQAERAIDEVMQGTVDEVRMAALLTALRVKGESIEELVGGARALRARAAPLPVTREGLLDTCGTGGDRLHTFNISTATALVAAAAGVPVAKHGNRGVSSSSGSSEVLEALGVKIDLAPERVARCIDEAGIGFCFAPLFHGAMKHAAPVRKRLGFRTIFNLLGPLANPARAEFQLLGTGSEETARKLAGTLQKLGVRRAIVVCGAKTLDEIALWGETLACRVEGETIVEERWSAATFGLPEISVDSIRVNSPAESAAVIRQLLAGENSAARQIVLANAAAALLTAERVNDLKAGVEMAGRAIDSGEALRTLKRLVEFSQQTA